MLGLSIGHVTLIARDGGRVTLRVSTLVPDAEALIPPACTREYRDSLRQQYGECGATMMASYVHTGDRVLRQGVLPYMLGSCTERCV
eukprot:1132500-Rhodomonas_salina.1